ncbi:MAG: heme-binding protein [Pseudomonadota bacterium]
MPDLTLPEAQTILAATFAKGTELGLKPLTVAILDAGGHLKAFQRADDTGIVRPSIAIGKAWTALGLRAPSRVVQDMAPDRPHFVAALGTMTGGNMVPAAGGVLIVKDGAVVGAVGVTGDLPEQDEACALAGVAAAGLSTAL